VLRRTPLKRTAWIRKARTPLRQRSPKVRRTKTLWRCKPHLKWVAGHSCIACGQGQCDGKMVAHHQRKSHGGGTGIKVGDDWTCPLCSRHHDEYHLRGCIGGWSVEETNERLTASAIDMAAQSPFRRKEEFAPL